MSINYKRGNQQIQKTKPKVLDLSADSNHEGEAILIKWIF